MKKIFILLIATFLLVSCFGKDVEETPENIVSNVVEVVENEVPEDADPSESNEEIPEDNGNQDEDNSENVTNENTDERIISGSDNDPRVGNTEGEGTNPPETQAPSVPTESTLTPAENEAAAKQIEEELDSLFELLEGNE